MKNTLSVAVGIASASFVIVGIKSLSNSARTLRVTGVECKVDDVLGDKPIWEGSKMARFTLVEFADFECRPCESAERGVQAILSRHQGELSFVFRNYPLTRVHRNAMHLARAYVSASRIGDPRRVRRILYEQGNTSRRDWNDAQILSIASKADIDSDRMLVRFRNVAKDVVERDVEDGNRLGITGTPSFFVVCPGNRVLRVRNLSEVPDIIRREVKY